jgi:hypothetical protein
LINNFDLSKLSAADNAKLNLLKLKQLQSIFLGSKPTFKPVTASTKNTKETDRIAETAIIKTTKSGSNPSTERYNGIRDDLLEKTKKGNSPSTERYNGIGQRDDWDKTPSWPGKTDATMPQLPGELVAGSPRRTSAPQQSQEETDYEEYSEEMYEEEEEGSWPSLELARDQVDKKDMMDKMEKPSRALQQAQLGMMESIKAQQAAERQALLQQASERLALERLAGERMALEKQASERLALEKQAAERLALEKLASERLALEKQAAERLALEKLASERIALEKQAAERLALERQASERLALERLAAERLTIEKQTAERMALERLAKERPASGQAAEKTASGNLPSEKQTTERRISDRQQILDHLASEAALASGDMKKAKKRPKASNAKPSTVALPSSDVIDPYYHSVAFGRPPTASDPYQTGFHTREASGLRTTLSQSVTTEKSAVVVNGQAFLDMSEGTRHQGRPDQLLPLRRIQLEDTEEEEDKTEERSEAVGQIPKDSEVEVNRRTQLVDDPEVNIVEKENPSRSSSSSSKKPEEEFTTELCDKLRVPCR